MARFKEQRLYDALKKARPSNVRLERIENLVGQGTPDLHVMVDGRSCWLELKAPIRPKRASTRLLGTEGLNQDQLNWFLEAARLDIPAYVLVRDDTREIFLVPARHCEGINELTAAQLRAVSVADTIDDVYGVLNENRTDGPPANRAGIAEEKS